MWTGFYLIGMDVISHAVNDIVYYLLYCLVGLLYSHRNCTTEMESDETMHT